MRFTLVLQCLVLAAAALGLSLTSGEAQAHRVFVGGGVIVGAPTYYYPPYYSYPYYYPAAPAYAPYPAYAPPNPAYPAPYPAPEGPPVSYYHDREGHYCREYTRTIIVGGQRQTAYGHACQQPDGQWMTVD